MGIHRRLRELESQHRLHGKLCASFATHREPSAPRWVVQPRTGGGAESILPGSPSGPRGAQSRGGGSSKRMALLESLRAGAGQGGFSLGGSGVSRGAQPLSSEARKLLGMEGLTGEMRAQGRVCRREKSGRSSFLALLRVSGDREVADLGPSVSHGCSPHPCPAPECRGRAALPALGSFPPLTGSPEIRCPPALPGHICPYSALLLPTLPAFSVHPCLCLSLEVSKAGLDGDLSNLV